MRTINFGAKSTYQSITDRSTPSASRYLKEYDLNGGYHILSKEQQNELAFAAQKGDTIAREKLIKSCLRLVISIAKYYESIAKQRGEACFTLSDLINEGNYGLCKSVDKYKKMENGSSFSNFCVFYIRGHILTFLYSDSNLVRQNGHLHKAIGIMRKEIEKIEKIEHRTVQPTEVSETLCNPELIGDEVLSYTMLSKAEEYFYYSEKSLSAPISRESKVEFGYQLSDSPEHDDLTYADVIPDQIDAADKIIIIKDLIKSIDRTLNTVHQRESFIIKLSFGLEITKEYLEEIYRPDKKNKLHKVVDYVFNESTNRREWTLEEIGALLELTRERVRQIKEKGIRRLRHNFRSSHLKVYL